MFRILKMFLIKSINPEILPLFKPNDFKTLFAAESSKATKTLNDVAKLQAKHIKSNGNSLHFSLIFLLVLIMNLLVTMLVSQYRTRLLIKRSKS